MYRQETKLKGLSEIRFGSMIFLHRMSGVPFQMKKKSTIYATYMVTVTVCCFSAVIGMFVDVYIHWDELGRAMTFVSLRISLCPTFSVRLKPVLHFLSVNTTSCLTDLRGNGTAEEKEKWVDQRNSNK